MYRYQRFGAVMLPDGSINQKIGSMDTANSLVTVAGGAVFDSLGSDDAPSKPGNVTLTANLRGNSRTDLETKFRQLQGLRGKVQKLYRAWEPSGLVEKIDARLIKATANADFWHNGKMPAIQLEWALLDSVWNGDDEVPWTFDSGEYFDTGLDFDNVGRSPYLTGCTNISCTHTFTITNNGNANVQNIQLGFYLGGPSPIVIGTLSIKKTSGTKCHIEYDAVLINTYAAVVMDTSNSTITVAATNGYQYFNLGSEHECESWLILEPGDNEFEISYTKTSTTLSIPLVSFQFADAWQ